MSKFSDFNNNDNLIEFYKMHGTGNDYIYIDCFERTIDNPGKLAVNLSRRRFGIGSDGLILIRPSEKADCFMDMYNADGSRGMMCGNGIRCVARYIYDKGLISGDKGKIETLSGVKSVKINTFNGEFTDVTVGMGLPILNAGEIPVNLSHALSYDCFSEEELRGSGKTFAEGHSKGIKYIKKMNIGTKYGEIAGMPVSMGNPHFVIFSNGDCVDTKTVEKIGRALETHPVFPENANIEFVRIIDSKNINMRVWERGSGETFACGTGACACVVAGIMKGILDNNVKVNLLGGSLDVFWNGKDGEVVMTGDAVYTYKGYFSL